MLSKFASMFLANIFYQLEIIFEIKKQDTRFFHSRIVLDKVYNIYFKINSSLTNTKLCHSAKKLVIHFKLLKYLSLLVCQHQIVVFAVWLVYLIS